MNIKILFTKSFPLLLITIFFLSCTTFPQAGYGQDLPASFSSITSIVPQWQPLAEGVSYFHGKIESPRIEFWSLQIDLLSPNIEIVVRSGGANTESNRPTSTKVSSFVRDNNLIAGINTVPFDISTSREGQPIMNMGIVVSGGVLLSSANSRYDALVFYKDKRAEIVNQSAIRSIENIENAVGGFYQILINGEPSQRTLNNETRHPRSTAGISDDGRYLYLLVIDGRRAASIGCTENETALLLLQLGSNNGINFDGGGSSALVIRFPDESIRPVNMPVHGNLPGTERAVAGCLGIRIINPSREK